MNRFVHTEDGCSLAQRSSERQTFLDFHTKMQYVNDEYRIIGKAKCCVSGDENETLLSHTVRSHEQSLDWRGEKTKSGKKAKKKSKPLCQAATRKKEKNKNKIKKYNNSKCRATKETKNIEKRQRETWRIGFSGKHLLIFTRGCLFF